MTSFLRLYLGPKNIHFDKCIEEGFIGTDFDIPFDLSGRLPETLREFNNEMVPVVQGVDPSMGNRSAGLACGMLWTVSKWLKIGDFVLCPNGRGSYRVGRITGDYLFAEGQILPHRRKVDWLPVQIEKSQCSQPLQNSMAAPSTTCDITQYAEEIQNLLAPGLAPQLRVNDRSIENPGVFALEKYLEDFLVSNWANTDFGSTHRIYEVDGIQQGRQLRTDTGPLDILAESTDGRELLVLELKKRPSFIECRRTGASIHALGERRDCA